MILSAQVSLYPLRQERLAPAIEQLREGLVAAGLHAVVGALSTTVIGEGEVLFAAVGEAFRRAARVGPVVLNMTVSNACPV